MSGQAACLAILILSERDEVAAWAQQDPQQTGMCWFFVYKMHYYDSQSKILIFEFYPNIYFRNEKKCQFPFRLSLSVLILVRFILKDQQYFGLVLVYIRLFSVCLNAKLHTLDKYTIVIAYLYENNYNNRVREYYITHLGEKVDAIHVPPCPGIRKFHVLESGFDQRRAGSPLRPWLVTKVDGLRRDYKDD